MVFGEGKMMLGIEPTVVGATEAVEGTAFDHAVLQVEFVSMESL
jgi:hypothetical protein